MSSQPFIRSMTINAPVVPSGEQDQTHPSLLSPECRSNLPSDSSLKSTSTLPSTQRVTNDDSKARPRKDGHAFVSESQDKSALPVANHPGLMTPQRKGTRPSVLNSPSASAKHRNAARGRSLFTEPPVISRAEHSAVFGDKNPSGRQFEKAGEDSEDHGFRATKRDRTSISSDGDSPFLVASGVSVPDDLGDFLSDQDTPKTPTRPKAGRTIIDHSMAQRSPMTRSRRTSQDDLYELDQDDSLDILRMRAKRNVEVASCIDGVLGNRVQYRVPSDGDGIPLPRTPSKPKHGMHSETTPSPRTPGAWLDRWKYNIMMSHHSMKPPKLPDDEKDDDCEEDDDEPDDSPLFEIPVRLELVTPKRKRTIITSLPQDFDQEQLSLSSTDDDGNITEHETPQDRVKQGTKRRTAGEVDDEDEEDDEHEAIDGEVCRPYGKKQLRLDFKLLDRLPFTPIRQQSATQFHTPPQKEARRDLSNIKPPRAPSISSGKLPMYRPQGVSHSPSQRRQRPDSYFDPLN